MRYDKPIFFVKNAGRQYNPDSGEWTESQPVKTKKYANVTPMDADRQQAVFGDVSSKRFIVRLQRVYSNPYDFIEISGKPCYVDNERCPSDKQSLVVMRNG